MANSGENFNSLDHEVFGEPADDKTLDEIIERATHALGEAVITASQNCARAIPDLLKPDEVCGYLYYQSEHSSESLGAQSTAISVVDPELNHTLLTVEFSPEGNVSDIHISANQEDQALAILRNLEQYISENSKTHGVITALRFVINETALKELDAESLDAINEKIYYAGLTTHIIETLQKSNCFILLKKEMIIHSNEEEELQISSRDFVFKDHINPEILSEQQQETSGTPRYVIEYNDRVKKVFYTLMELINGSRYLLVNDYSEYEENQNLDEDTAELYDAMIEGQHLKPRRKASEFLLEKMRKFIDIGKDAIDAELNEILGD